MTEHKTKHEHPVIPKQYAGKWVAWDHAQANIIASGTTFRDARQAAIDAGELDPLLEKVPRADVRFAGAGA